MAIDRPTIWQHIEIARDIKAAQLALEKVLKHSRFFYARETDKVGRAYNGALFGKLRSRLEETMFEDYEYLSNDFLRLYYGDLEDVDELEGKVKDIAFVDWGAWEAWK